jgi:hypothetical protein
LRALGIIPSHKGDPKPFDFKHGVGGFTQSMLDRAEANGLNTHLFFGKRPINNPGAMMKPGSLTDYQQFTNVDAGIRALAGNIRRYGNKYNKWTPAEIINRYEGGEVGNPHHNDIKSYIEDVVRTSGFKANQRIDLNNNNELARLLSAIIKHEGVLTGGMDSKTIVQILNSTGGSAVVQASQVGVSGLKSVNAR